MKNQTRRHIRRINKAQRQRHYVVAVFACVALVLATGVAFALRRNGRAATHQEQVLSCPVTGTVAHTHDGNCYDADGNPVCTLPEVEYHVHDDSCYSEERALVCGLEEGEEHVHTDACYQTERTLVCGKDEVTEAHQHGAGCFETVEVADSMPEQAFEHRFVDGKDNEVLRVIVSAPEGALPEGSTMEAKWVDTAKKKNAEVKAVIEEAVAKKTDAEIAEVHAVDITFRDAEGNEVEPAKKVTVTMVSPQIADQDIQQLLVHVESDREAQERAERAGESTYQIEGSVIEPLTARQLKKRDLPDEADELVFDADQFSVYAIAYTVDFRYDVDGESYDYTLQGGDSVSLRELLQGMKVFKAKDADKFMAEVKDVTFSDTSLLAVAHVEEATTAGVLRERLGLQVQHSSELTEEQVAEMDAKQFKKGDWALLSLRPFTSDEKLTVTMNNGDVLTVRVTDAQITTLFLSASGKLYEVTVTYDETAGIPEGSSLRVTEFAEDAAEYEHARNAVLADKKARGEWVDLNCFGLAALDISILNPEGTEIEPQAPVQVDIRIKELPGVEDLSEVADTLAIQHHVEVGDGVVVETVYDGSAEASFELQTNETVVAEGTAVDPDSVSEDDFKDRDSFNKAASISFETEKFSTFTVTWRPWGSWSDSKSVVHYGYMDGNTFVEFSKQPSPVSITQSNRAYLIYDFEGYQYSGYTYYRNNQSSTPAIQGTRIQALLRYNYGWQYRNYSTNTNGRWSDMAHNSHIYVVYEPETAVPQGGTPVPKQTDDTQYPAEPELSKESTDNHDGTRTLSLSVAGHTEELEVEKLADVIVVFDTSGSMSEDMDGNDTNNNSRRRLTIAKNAVNAMARALLSKTNSSGDKLIRMSLISFNDYATVNQGFTDNYNTFSGAVNGLSAENGTNWEHALKLANQMAVESDRATFVIFVSDGDPTSRVSRMNANDNDLDIYNKGTDPDYLSEYHIFGTGSTDPYGFNYEAALSEAESIVGHNKNFYTIAISNDVSKMERLSNDAGGNGNYTATTSTELEHAFNDIAESITALMGHSDVKITDGITDLTQTVQKSSLVNFAEDDFTYYKGHAATAEDVANGRATSVGETVWESWDPSSEGCAEAVYNTNTGAVEWNMGEGFMLEEGYTYQVRFKVWPSQDAYDLLADLNNGKKSYDSLTAAEKAQISEPATEGGVYTLKTNSETSYTYREATKSGETVTPTGDPSEPGSFPEVDPLELTTKPLKVKKQWHNNYVDSRTLTDSITMELYGVDSDGSTSRSFKTFTLSKDEDWYAENNYISYGLVTYDTTTNAGAKVYETGHDFTLRETDDEAHYYELTAGVFRPMFINGTPTILELVDEAPAGMSNGVFHYFDGSHHYYGLDGKVYRDTQSDTLLIATNTHRSYMDLNKVVVDESGVATVDDQEFEYEICFTVPSGIANYDTEKYIWFSVTDAQGQRLNPSTYSHSNNLIEYGNYLVATSGVPFTLKIKQGWNARFLNLPIDTTYSFEEINIPTECDFVKTEVSGTRWIADMVGGKDQGQAETMTGLPANNSASNEDTGINGTITYANARYKTTYTNKTLTQQVYIQKTDQEGTTPLPGAVFALYTKSGYEADPKTAAKTNLTSDKDGKVDLGKLACGTYYLVETSAPEGFIKLADPVTITVESNGVTYSQSDQSQSSGGQGVTFDEATKTYTLRVTNNAGAELPAAGGRGTRAFTALGGALILGAVALLWARRRLA